MTPQALGVLNGTNVKSEMFRGVQLYVRLKSSAPGMGGRRLFDRPAVSKKGQRSIDADISSARAKGFRVSAIEDVACDVSET